MHPLRHGGMGHEQMTALGFVPFGYVASRNLFSSTGSRPVWYLVEMRRPGCHIKSCVEECSEYESMNGY